MSQSEATVWGARAQGVVHLRIDGRATADLCPALRAYCERHFDSGARNVRVHLSGCEHFDSTFLGTLLCLQAETGRAGGDRVVLVVPHEACLRNLRRMGAPHLFPIVEDAAADEAPPEDLTWIELAAEPVSRESPAFQQQVVFAHRRLAEVPGPLGERYRPVAEQVSREFESRR